MGHFKVSSLHIIQQGGGDVSTTSNGITLSIPPSPDHYANAMVASYKSHHDFAFHAGTRLSFTAHTEGKLAGTTGFGFWNHPGQGLRLLPRAVWFFSSTPPNNMPLALGVAGNGFKVAVFNTRQPAFYALAPLAPIGFLAMRNNFLYRKLWPIGQRAIGVDEHALDTTLLTEPHHYAIDWHATHIDFRIDGTTVFTTRRVPQGKLGFTVWIDNQYAVVTPQGKFGAGIIPATQPQKLILRDVTLTS